MLCSPSLHCNVVLSIKICWELTILPSILCILGKTLLAKAVANQTSATFLRVVGSELIQKYLGDGPKLVRELFRVAEEHAPSIVFIDEIDAIGTKRYTDAALNHFRLWDGEHQSCDNGTPVVLKDHTWILRCWVRKYWLSGCDVILVFIFVECLTASFFCVTI